MREWLSIFRAFPPLLLAAPYILVIAVVFYVCSRCVDRLPGLWLRFKYPKETTMTPAQRQRQRRIARLRGERPAFGLTPDQVAEQARADLHTDKAIDRGLVEWWS